ncbi:MAG TPA: hypothetical protein VJS37_10485, partial [Terriglobales bacterium]|nr:hypothetical protein [Terriglobales bacterium]
LRQESVCVLDAALCEISGCAKIRTASTTRATSRVRTWPADDCHHQITWPETVDLWPDLDYFR